MYKTVYLNDFLQAFEALRPNNFTEEGLEVLFDFLEAIEYKELDVIELCCDYLEYDSMDQYYNDYSDAIDSLDQLEEHTIVLPVGDDGGFIMGVY